MPLYDPDYFPDFETKSFNGHFLLEARSPDNGVINNRDGTVPSIGPDYFRPEDQRGFRYRLSIAAAGSQGKDSNGDLQNKMIWERWQEDGEESPVEAVVADNGWSIVRTFGLLSEIIVVDPQGSDAMHVRIAESEPEQLSKNHESVVSSWIPSRVMYCGKGLLWAEKSLRYFFKYDGRSYFVWRTSWGQRLIIDLGKLSVVTESIETESFTAALIGGEKDAVCELLLRFDRKIQEVYSLFEHSEFGVDEPLKVDPQIQNLIAAFHLVAVYRLVGMIAILRKWEQIDCPHYSQRSVSMGGEWCVELQWFRPIIHHTLRLLGQEPLGFPAYYFHKDWHRIQIPERIKDRAGKATQIRQSMLAEEVLNLIGSPDHIRWLEDEGRSPAVYWLEVWEFDFLVSGAWSTLRITWADSGGVGEIRRIETVPAGWLQSDEREAEILEI